MELSRSEYPSIVASVPPSPAVKLVRDRLHKGQLLNQEIAEWLQERRRAEDAYAQALAKLAKKPTPSENWDFGVFAAPWSRIVESTLSLAASHQQLSQKLESEVERPIREFSSRNSEWLGMKMMETNLAAVAKAIDSTEERAEKLRKRGQKAKAQQVAEASSAVSNAYAEWDSQAPYVFEKLQVADESRCNNLRDSLTRMQTFELDHAQSAIQAAEATLALMLDVSTNDEVKAFTSKSTAGRQKIERQRSRTVIYPPHPSTPSIVTDDSVSVQSSGSGGGTLAGGNHGLGLKRLGTVLRNRNRNSMFYRSTSPDRRSKVVPPPLPPSPLLSRNNSPKQDDTIMSTSQSLGGISEKNSSLLALPQSNGNHDLRSMIAEPTPSSVPPMSSGSNEPLTDAEGYSIPPPVHGLAGTTISDDTEETQPQFKVEIKNDVIHEEEDEADAALSKVANTLRAQNTVSRRTRGRRDARDVRSTMFIPNPPELTPDITGSPPLTPLKLTPRPPNALSEEGSDTHSIKSYRSINSLGPGAIRHPELTTPGLSASLVEAVSMSFEGNQQVKAVIIGEIALGHNQQEISGEPTSVCIRMDNFSVLEKVAPNPGFISTIPDRAGDYNVSLPNIHKTSVAFKYQVHIDESNTLLYAPLIVSPVWKLEPHQSSVIISWKPNPQYRRMGNATNPFTLRNSVFFVGIDGANASSCQSKPVGTFLKEKRRLAWKLGDITVDPSQAEGGKLLARFATDALARSIPVEVRWEISGEDAETVGCGLSLSVLEPEAPKVEEDPFADVTAEDRSTSGEGSEIWTPVTTTRKIVSGKYMAV